MDWNELLHPLYSAFWHGLCVSPCLFLLWNVQGAGRDQPKIWNPFCSTLWTGFCLTSLHTVILWCSMRCPVILGMIGRPSARASGACLYRENKASSWICGNSPEGCKQRSWPFHWWSVAHGWVSTGSLASVFWGSVEIKCLTVLRVYCVFSSLSERWAQVKLIQHFE